jgi:hypothetical protein
MRARRALAHLLMIVSLTLLQCLQPLLHAHPRQAGAASGSAPGTARIHLPDTMAFKAAGQCDGSVPATITAQDESRRVALDLHAHPAPVPERRLPGTGMPDRRRPGTRALRRPFADRQAARPPSLS